MVNVDGQTNAGATSGIGATNIHWDKENPLRIKPLHSKP